MTFRTRLRIRRMDVSLEDQSGRRSTTLDCGKGVEALGRLAWKTHILKKEVSAVGVVQNRLFGWPFWTPPHASDQFQLCLSLLGPRANISIHHICHPQSIPSLMICIIRQRIIFSICVLKSPRNAVASYISKTTTINLLSSPSEATAWEVR